MYLRPLNWMRCHESSLLKNLLVFKWEMHLSMVWNQHSLQEFKLIRGIF